MKRILSNLLVATLAVMMLTGSFVTASAEQPAAASIEASDIDLQLSLIASQAEKMKQTDGLIRWFYSVTDLDHDGNLEFIAAAQHPQDRSTNLRIWEVSEDRKALSECSLDIDADESFPDILTDTADTYHNTQTDTWSYVLNDNIVLSNTEVYAVKTAVTMKDGVVSYNPFAIEHTVIDGNNVRNVSHTDMNGMAISPEQFNAAASNALAGNERSNTAFEWLKSDELNTISRLTDSYAVFTGAKAPTEFMPVPKPAALEDPAASPSPAVTPVPNATPVPTPVPVPVPTPAPQPARPTFLSITKNPTNENKKVGGTATFVACSNIYDSLNWTFVSPNGGEYTPANFVAGSTASVSGEYSTTISVSRLEDWMNGWGAYCTFYYQGQTARTSTAYISINGTPTPAPAPVPVPDGGTFYGSVVDWNYSSVSVNLDGSTVAAIPWDVCTVSGEIYIGAPATVMWNGTTTKGLNYTYCSITGSQSAPQPSYGSMSGTASEGGGGFAIRLMDGTEVFADAWICNVSGNFYNGAPCTVYYTDRPSTSTVYQVDIYGSYDTPAISPSDSKIIVEEPYFSDYYLVDGTEVIEAADGTVTYIDPDGSWSSTYADGTWEYYDSVTGETGGGMIYD